MSDEAILAERPAATSGSDEPSGGSTLRDLWLVAKLDVAESLRARWFAVYSVVFGGMVALRLPSIQGCYPVRDLAASDTLDVEGSWRDSIDNKPGIGPSVWRGAARRSDAAGTG